MVLFKLVLEKRANVEDVIFGRSSLNPGSAWKGGNTTLLSKAQLKSGAKIQT
jgi:hypothetical protein